MANGPHQSDGRPTAIKLGSVRLLSNHIMVIKIRMALQFSWVTKITLRFWASVAVVHLRDGWTDAHSKESELETGDWTTALKRIC